VENVVVCLKIGVLQDCENRKMIQQHQGSILAEFGDICLDKIWRPKW